MAFEEKKYQLELYNALNGSDYDDPEAVEVTTLEDTFFIFETLTSRFITRLRTVESIEHFRFIRKCVYVGAHISIQFY